MVVADGCNWGRGPMTAANRARDAVLSYLRDKDARIRDGMCVCVYQSK
jgi:hypothetical protein